MKKSYKFWSLVGILWIGATLCDRLWWHHYSGIPSWDQADYLNSALDHGRALGLLPQGEWKGWNALLDLSPKIPPLASLVNGSVISFAGDEPKQAAWNLSIWNGILMASVAAWGIRLKGPTFALLGVTFIAIAPALLELRSDYVLEMPLTATITLAMWRLGCWWDPIKGGRWIQAICAATICTAAVLVKQSALLVLVPAILWSTYSALRRNTQTRLQLVACYVIGILGIFPWLRHNWITSIGGTNRAVFESAAREGDPSILSLENWLWYPRLLNEQIGAILLIIGISGLILWFTNNRSIIRENRTYNFHKDDLSAWRWLIINLLTSWLLTTISPNKGDRYIAPILPSLILLLARGWIQWGLWMKQYRQKYAIFMFPTAIMTGLLASLVNSWNSQLSLLKNTPKGPIREIIELARNAKTNDEKKTIIVVPSTPDLNQHNVSYFGRMNGGKIVGRQLGSSNNDVEPVLNQAELVILAEGSQGSIRKSALILDKAVRESKIFNRIGRFDRPNGDSYSLWSRKSDYPKTTDFSRQFTNLATGLAEGPKGLKPIFAVVEKQHMLDGHFKYRIQVRQDNLEKLQNNPYDLNARWSLALLDILSNRLNDSSKHFEKLELILPNNSWPSTYRTLVTLASLNPWEASNIARKVEKSNHNKLLTGLSDLSNVLGGSIWRIPAAKKSIPEAITMVEKALN